MAHNQATICTECGGDTHTEALPDHRLNNVKDDIKPVEVRKIVCNHCDATGSVLVKSGMNPSTDIRDGPFAELSREGIQKLRENKGFVPVYER